MWHTTKQKTPSFPLLEEQLPRTYHALIQSVSRATLQRPSRHWAWLTTDVETSDDAWKRKLSRMKQAGVAAILPEVFNGREAYFESRHLPVKTDWLARLLPLAKQVDLQVHAWIWCMPCNIEEVAREHPEWYVENRIGESAAVKPAYVQYYKFLCPTQPAVQQFVRRRVEELLQYHELDGIHCDYIRFPDVILAEGLWSKYGIVQDREYPQYDYCYCRVCRDAFRREAGIDLDQLEDPSLSREFRQFRQDRVSQLVNDVLLPVIRAQAKMATAAVFPNWHHVRQQWPKWKVDAVLPMLYHRFYNQDVDWIAEQTRRGVEDLRGSGVSLYSGLFVPHLNPQELGAAMRRAREAGAAGVSLFSERSMTDAHWQEFKAAAG